MENTHSLGNKYATLNNFCGILIMMFSFLGFSQNPSLIRTNLSPGGLLDNVFDGNGNRYNLNDVMYQSSRILTNGTLSTTTLQENAGYFRLFFENGCGMEGSSAIEVQRRAVVIQVFNDISNFIPSPLTTNGLNNKVNIWVRNISNIPNVPPTALGLATPFFSIPFNTTTGFGGIADNEIWKTIHLGKDSYTGVAPQITINSGNNTGMSGMFYHGMIAFNFTSFPWNTNLGVLANTSQYDLYTVVLHEVIHTLGFASLLNQNGTSLFGLGFNYFSRYDRFLKNNSNTASLITNTGNCLLYNYSFNPNSSIITPTVLRPTCTLPNNLNTGISLNSTIASNALRFIGSSLTNLNIPLYTPTCFELGSSLSHFEDTNFTPPTGFGFTSGNDLYFTMSNANGMGTNKRYPKKEERLALLELGYSVTNTFGLSSTLQGVPPVGYYNASASGVTVAGISDGINTNNNYTYTGVATLANPITINSPTDTSKQILFNDTNATNFECLEDITDSSAFFSETSGTLTTNVTFSSVIPGLHLLRYVPFNASGRGNITYIYVYVNDSSVSCAIPSACNLVSNGDFEQYSSLNIPFGGISNSCGWKTGNNGSPDYFNLGNISNTPFSIPCNSIGTQTSNNSIGNAYAGVGFSVPNFNINAVFAEHIYTKLATPLIAGTTYQLSFDVSLAEGSSSFAYQLQAYFSNYQLPQLSSTGYILTANSLVTSLVDTTTRTNYNGWEKITFIYTATGGEQFLYIGGLQSQQITQINAAPLNTSCNNGNYDTYYNQPANLQYRGSYYYLDNITLVAASLDLPASICINTTLTDLRQYLSPGIPPTGTFSGQSVTYNSLNGLYSFVPQVGITSSLITYTYTNNLGCFITLSDTITVNPNTSPTFPTIPELCQGSTPPTLPTTSNNGITGTWSPATISTAASGNYTFTPAAGQCGNAISVAVQVLSNTAFVTNTDAFTVTLGSYVTTSVTTPSVLINDTYNGGVIPTTIAGVPYTLVLTGTPPTIPSGSITFNATTGIFTVAPNTTAGTYVYQYYLQNNCYSTAVTTVKIVVNRMVYENQIGLSFCYGTTAANSGTTLYLGTKINGVQTDATNATITVINPTTLLPTSLPAGITSISPNGSVNLAPGVLPGQITFYYKICSTSFGSCTVTKTCIITIERTFFGNPDTITTSVGGGVTYNVRSNDTYRGGCGTTNLVPATTSNTTITSVVNAVVNNVTYYSINQSTGAIQPNYSVTIPSGSYILSYTLCDNANLNICQNVSVRINVPSLKMSNNNTNSKIFDIQKTVVAPNPSNGIFTVYFNTLIEEADIELYTLVGQKVFEKVLKNTSEELLLLNRMASGTYLLKISTNKQSIMKRIIIE